MSVFGRASPSCSESRAARGRARRRRTRENPARTDAPPPSGRGAGTRQRPDLPPRRRGRVLPLRPRCRGYRGVEAQSDSPGPQGGPDLFAVPVSASCSLIEDPPRLSARAESDVAGVRILDNLDLRLRRDDEVSNGLGGAVEELVRTGRTTRERDDIASS